MRTNYFYFTLCAHEKINFDFPVLQSDTKKHNIDSGVARVIVFFGGRGKMRAPKARVILGGSGGMLPRENFEI